jgi:hypothetical protein
LKSTRYIQAEIYFLTRDPLHVYRIAKGGHLNRGASTSYGALTNATGNCPRKGKKTSSLKNFNEIDGKFNL